MLQRPLWFGGEGRMDQWETGGGDADQAVKLLISMVTVKGAVILHFIDKLCCPSIFVTTPKIRQHLQL